MIGRFDLPLRWAAWGIVAGLVLFAAGCEKGRAMTDVSGTVTVDGEPLEEGQILIRRTDGEMKGYGAAINRGAYKLRCEPGDVKIEITSYRIVPGKFTTVNGPKEPVREMFIPKKYNEKTELLKTLSGSSNSLSFDLTTK